MNTGITKSKFFWPAIGAAALIAWTIFCELTWLRRHHPRSLLSGLPAFFLGLFILILLAGVVRLCRGAFKQGWRWLFSRDAFRVCAWTAAFAISLVALFYAVELWRGHRAWASVVREAKARGEPLQQPAVSTRVPDELNFAKAPIFAFIFTNRSPEVLWDYRAATNLMFTERHNLPYTNWHAKELPWLDQEKVYVRAYAEYYEGKKLRDIDETEAAKLLLNALTRYAPIFNQVREYSSRPYCQFPVSFENPELAPPVHSVPFRDLLNLLGQRASSELILHQSDAAFEDLQLCLRLVNYYRQQTPALPARGNVVLSALQPLWEGLASHAWNEQQLSNIQRQLEAWNLFSDYQQETRANALYMASFVESVIPTSRSPKTPALNLGKDVDEFGLRAIRLFYPVGWSLQDQAAIHRYHLRCAEPLLYLHHGRPFPVHTWKTLFTSSDPFFPLFVVPKVLELAQSTSLNYFLSQTMANEALLACALERYRLARGAYPETLQALIPDYVGQLPNDLINGQPLKYRRPAQDRFVLYSVGINNVDDGGMPSPRDKDWHGISRPRPTWNHGDWVWTYGWPRKSE